MRGSGNSKGITGRKSPSPEEFTPINEAVSTTGKYAIAFGQHFRPMICYDVIALNRMTGEAKRVHFNDDKAQALACWDKFRDQMTGPRTTSEEDEPDGFQIFGPTRTTN
jgi:hypothetical protein